MIVGVQLQRIIDLQKMCISVVLIIKKKQNLNLFFLTPLG